MKEKFNNTMMGVIYMKIVLQDCTAIINNTSRYNNKQYDTVHVETLLVTDQPIQQELSWYVPKGVSLPPEIAQLLKTQQLKMFPQREDTLLSGTEDIIDQSKQGNLAEVISDASKLILRATLEKKTLTPIAGASNVYMLSYDYKLYPLHDVDPNNNTFEFYIVLPFDGLELAGNGRVQMTILTPIQAQIDTNATKGIAHTGQEISEMVYDIPHTQRKAISFAWQQDPEFIVRYHY